MKYRVVVTQFVEVELDESKFDDKFMEEFRASFYQFDNITEHVEHIAQLQARGVIDLECTPEFIEGYGPSNEMGIKARNVELEITDVEVVK